MKVSDLMKGYFDDRIREVDREYSPNLLSDRILSEQALPVKTKPGLDWDIERKPNRLRKKFKFKKRKHLLNFISDVIEYENETQHHARILIQYKTVTIDVWTHDLRDITSVDKEYARTVNQIYEDSNANLDE